MKDIIYIRNFGIKPYTIISKCMNFFTKNRTHLTYDELWLVQHRSVFTQGVSLKKNNSLLKINNIPLLQSNRGGKITYHGLGQQIMYILIDIKRKKLNIKKLINAIEQSIIDTLYSFKIKSHICNKKPGVFVNNEKICSLGLRIIRGCSLHGVALNVKMNLDPFSFIDPCGFSKLKMTQISYFYPKVQIKEVALIMINKFTKILNINKVMYI